LQSDKQIRVFAFQFKTTFGNKAILHRDQVCHSDLFYFLFNDFIVGSLAETNENQYEESGKRSVLTDFSFCQIL